jgi:hypothetical protein
MLRERKDIILLELRALHDIRHGNRGLFMAKKTAPKKKVAKKDVTKTSKAKAATKLTKAPKSNKAVKAPKEPKALKTAKPSKAGPAPKKEKKPVPPTAAVKPALMSKKNKVEAEPVVEKKSKSVVSLMESDTPAVASEPKVEKISKVKPVKVDRGNLADEKAKWAELFKKYGKEKAINYKMTETYPALIPLQHKVLGWGFVLTNENHRLEVLFENGIRMLISNYKSV